MLEKGTCAMQLVVPVEVDTALAYLPVKKEGQNLDSSQALEGHTKFAG